jgi:predicted enzyme related to lactoylglutathione lyase
VAGCTCNFAMHVTEAGYDEAVATLRERGADVREHRFDPEPPSRAAYVEDPDGNVVELWTWDVAGHLRQLS